MKRWHGSCIGAALVLLIGGASLIFIVPFGAAMVVGFPPLFDAITERAVCPGAVSIEKDESNSGPVTTSPSGPSGHQEEWICTFKDGAQKVIPNEEIFFKGFGASSLLAGVCGGLVVLTLMIVAAIIGGKLVKPSV